MATLLWIVDDDEDDRWLIQEAVQHSTWEGQIVYFSDGASVLAQLTSPGEIPHLIVMDYQLPGINALELTRHLRGCPGFEGVPVGWMSSEVDPAWGPQGAPLGVQWYWAKPVTHQAWQQFVEGLSAMGSPARRFPSV